MRKLLILRPEPGASATAERARAVGLEPVVRPLFGIEPVAWGAVDPAEFDAMLLTSANSLRHGGRGLAALAELPVVAVGATTADAARDAGFSVVRVGNAGVTSLLDALPGGQRLLHLCGEDRTSTSQGHDIHPIVVYRAVTMEYAVWPGTAEMVAMVHSPRAGERLAMLTADRRRTVIAAISEAAAMACGSGWERSDWPQAPTDMALLALAARLCQSPAR